MTNTTVWRSPDERIRTIEPEDWQQYRDLRLRALQDSPDAFGSTYADAKLLSDEQWQARVSNLSNTRDLPLFADTRVHAWDWRGDALKTPTLTPHT
ncbi:MAG: hypothetical protein HC809_03045 [Gammaproteobacteria bacterium]|nr:hypothetical protein [Gammaproteobacteria bacterium]